MPTTHFDPAVQNPIQLLIAKEQISTQDVGELLKALIPMTLNADAVREYAGRLRIAFDGYDDDAREVYAVPEIRRFVAAVTESFPYWFHYCDKTDDSLFAVMACLIEIDQVETTKGVVSVKFKEGGLSALIGELFEGVNGLYDRAGLSKDEQSVMTRQIGEYVQAFF